MARQCPAKERGRDSDGRLSRQLELEIPLKYKMIDP
jgi:hypothetical protein